MGDQHVDLLAILLRTLSVSIGGFLSSPGIVHVDLGAVDITVP